MANILIHTGDEPVILSPKALRRLLDRGGGDAALLYLALLRHQGTLSPQALTKEMRWEQSRMDAAERVLKELELVTPDVEQPNNAQEPEKKHYQQEEIAFQLENSAEFRQLTAQVESRLGKRLSPSDLSILLRLLNELDMPSDVVYTLVNHCAERYAARYGEGRRPKMSSIERTGVQWYEKGIDTQAAAAEYLKRYAKREGDYADYMEVLRMEDRAPVSMEETYLSAWREMGFPADAVALAYERTVFRCHEFKWEFCDTILKSWHNSGCHTVAEIEKGDAPEQKKKRRKKDASEEAGETELWQYAEQLRKKRERKKKKESET